MAFDAEYRTGVIWQDFQHKQLIDLFQKIKLARSDNKDKNMYQYTVAFLAMYVNHHFQLEEEYMEKYQFPDTALHKKEHHEFVQELVQFRKENREYSETGVDNLLKRMGEWIRNHIMKNDKKLGQFILEKEQPSR